MRLPNANAFQLQITEYASQYTIINISKCSASIPITNQEIELTKLLAESGLSVDGKSIIKINLRRFGKSYTFNLKVINA